MLDRDWGPGNPTWEDLEEERRNKVYFDAVLDGELQVLFNGTREETIKWLRENPEKGPWVSRGEDMRTFDRAEYLEMYGDK